LAALHLLDWALVDDQDSVRYLGMARRRLGWRLGACLAMAACAAALVSGPPAGAGNQRVDPTGFRRRGSVVRLLSGSAAGTHVTVPGRSPFVNTGIAVRVGDAVTINASGYVHFGGPPITHLDPAGVPWGPRCSAIAKGQARNSRWPAPGLSCWSLIGRLGTGSPFEVGANATVHAHRAGDLFLGVNDNYLPDNSGQFSVTVNVSPPSITTPSTSTVPPVSTGKKRSSASVLAVVAAVVALFVVAGLWLLVARRRRRKRTVNEPAAGAAAAIPDPATMNSSSSEVPSTRPVEETIAPAAVFAPPEADSIDVNIFEVEFSNGLTLRVGYNHFPDGTELRWRVTQSRVPAASGMFITRGGGSTNHVETVPLGVKLAGRDTHPDGADVQFDWSINGVPFRYSVRRDPNC
jgi:hypothetical protein